MSPADEHLVARHRAVTAETAGPIVGPLTREIANVMFQRAMDGAATTVDDLAAMGHWSRATVERLYEDAATLTQHMARNFGVV